MTANIARLLPDGIPGTGFVPSNVAAPEVFTTADTTELVSEFHTDESAGIYAGVWQCAPTREVIAAYPVNEMMTVISGSVTLTREDGSAETFAAGDTFFVAKGTPCTWEITETLKKYYMIAE